MFKLTAISLFLLFSFVLFPQKGMTQNWHTGGVLSEIQASTDIRYLDIRLTLDPDQRKLSGMVEVHLIAKKEGVDRAELDLIRNYTVSSVRANGEDLVFSHKDDKLFIELGSELSQTDALAVQISYSGQPHEAKRPPWEGGFTWSKDSNDYYWVGLSSQLEGGKLWLPVIDHPTSRADSASVRITLPKPYFVASNGLLQGVMPAQDGWHTYHWKTRYPIHYYNINITAGMFEIAETTYITETGAEMPVVFYVQEEFLPQAPGLLAKTIRKLEQLREYYGEYGFVDEKFGLVHTPYLGMEHQTINAYGNNFEYTSTSGGEYDWLLLHEMGHEWWGNLVTVSDWADFWIHEGITTFTDALYIWDFASPEEYYAKMKSYIPRIKNEMPIIPGENITSAEVYNHDVYYKGAYFMHSLMHIMGREVFLDAIAQFVDENRHGYTSTKAFMTFFDLRTEIHLEPFFEQYLYKAALPTIVINADKAGEGKYLIHIESDTENLRIPVEIETSEGIIQVMLSQKPVEVLSTQMPEADPNGWYLWEDIYIYMNCIMDLKEE
ncbi:MAG: M1 family metallopeptidase [Balneolales bacterium]|nr:M1 family metallopeptidase [Balneolales bacterium]